MSFQTGWNGAWFRLLPLMAAFACSSLAYAESETEQEVKQTILESIEYINKNLTGRPDEYSQHGALEFWSSGGLLQEIAPGVITAGRWEVFNIQAKHIKVITLVEGQATPGGVRRQWERLAGQKP